MAIAPVHRPVLAALTVMAVPPILGPLLPRALVIKMAPLGPVLSMILVTATASPAPVPVLGLDRGRQEKGGQHA
jgi:hypothetical protein